MKGEEKDLVSNKIFNGEKFVEKTKTVELQETGWDVNREWVGRAVLLFEGRWK